MQKNDQLWLKQWQQKINNILDKESVVFVRSMFKHYIFVAYLTGVPV